jgi:hypothetical protein
MAKKKSVRGGARKGSGRKPVKDKKVPVTFYIQKSVVRKLGLAKTKSSAIDGVMNEHDKLKK